MHMSIGFIVMSVLVIGIWVLIEVKRLKHKLFAIAMVGLIIFGYISFVSCTSGENLDLTTVAGLTDASKIYFSWLGMVFGNFKTITSNVVKMDWETNETNYSELNS